MGELGKLIGSLLVPALAGLTGGQPVAPGLVELRIPLEDGRFYWTRDFYEQANQELKTDYPLEQIENRRCELSLVQKVVLVQLSRGWPDLLQVELASDQLILRVPDTEDPAVRQRLRGLVKGLLPSPSSRWPAGKGLALPERFDPQGSTVLLIHGLDADTSHLAPLGRAFEAIGVQVARFDYPNDGPLAEAGERLHEALSELSEQHPKARVVVVAHSMGGLVARYALEAKSPPPRCVTDLFTLGTPHYGSRAAVIHPWTEYYERWRRAASGDLTALVWGHAADGLGEAAKDLAPGSRLLARLNGSPRPAGVRYHTAAGRRGIVSERQQQQIAAEVERLLAQREVDVILRSKILRFVQAPELQTGRGDGAVTIESALLTDADSSRTFDLNHIELTGRGVRSSEGDQVFRWIVDTLHWNRDDVQPKR